MPFKVGEQLYVPEHGVGVIRRIEHRLEGTIYVMSIVGTGLVYSVPLVQLEVRGIRALIPASAVERVYDVLRADEEPSHDPWKRRRPEYAHRLATGDPLQVAFVLRELARLEARKKLSAGEREMYDRARSLVVHELAAVRGVNEHVVQKEIDEIFAT